MKGRGKFQGDGSASKLNQLAIGKSQRKTARKRDRE